jgi:hypothetical protein
MRRPVMIVGLNKTVGGVTTYWRTALFTCNSYIGQEQISIILYAYPNVQAYQNGDGPDNERIIPLEGSDYEDFKAELEADTDNPGLSALIYAKVKAYRFPIGLGVREITPYFADAAEVTE